MKEYNLSIFIFRRDFRLDDNIGLMEALKMSKTVLPIFIFTPEQIMKNKYKSDNCVQFMIESLDDLDKDLRSKGSRLFYFYGENKDVIRKLIKKESADAVFLNMDYTPYSLSRDKSIKKVCDDLNIKFNFYEDILLNPIGSITTSTSDSVYQKFTPYFNVAKKISVAKPKTHRSTNYYSKNKKIVGEFKGDVNKFYKFNPKLAENGGRVKGKQKLNSLQNFKKYNSQRNILNIETTRLSAYIKFGCVSIREVYHKFREKLGMKNDLIKQLYWRDFYYNIAYAFPRVFSPNSNLKENYDKIKWNSSKKYYDAWCLGETGFPVVDACMREMNETGFMHNRGRLIVSSFLIKLLRINWKHGERYFAQTLMDYDPNVNNGNWGWSSGSGADSQPYFRIFNPWLQSAKYDPDATYIKKWIPELKDVEPKHLHQWDKYHKLDEYKDIDYFEPLIDYNDAKKKGLKMYKKAFT